MLPTAERLLFAAKSAARTDAHLRLAASVLDLRVSVSQLPFGGEMTDAASDASSTYTEPALGQFMAILSEASCASVGMLLWPGSIACD